jgi:uncharacterized LabA/DUF88 family protein
MERVAIFVDVQNIYYTVKQNYNCHFNYNAFWADVTSERKVIKAIAYAIDRGDKKQIEFQQILKKIGFEVKLKPFIQRSDGSAKGDWDVGITLDMIDYAEDVDVVVLASGDGDFDLVIDKIRNEYNVSVEVYGVPNLTAQSLIDSATQFIPIEGNLLLSM